MDQLQHIRAEVAEIDAVLSTPEGFDTDVAAERLGLTEDDEHFMVMQAGLAWSEAKGWWRDAEKHMQAGETVQAVVAAFKTGGAVERFKRHIMDPRFRHGARAEIRQRGRRHGGVTQPLRMEIGSKVREAVAEHEARGESSQAGEWTRAKARLLREAREATGNQGLTWRTLRNWGRAQNGKT